jgi:hypothetical protein
VFCEVHRYTEHIRRFLGEYVRILSEKTNEKLLDLWPKVGSDEHSLVWLFLME